MTKKQARARRKGQPAPEPASKPRGDLASSVVLEDIVCREFSARFLRDVNVMGNTLLVPTWNISPGVRVPLSKDSIGVKIEAKLTGEFHGRLNGEEAQFPLTEVLAVFLLNYKVKEEGAELAIDQNAVETLSATTAVFQVWPYLREAFQSGTTRLGMNPFVLPVLTMSNAAPGIAPLRGSGDAAPE